MTKIAGLFSQALGSALGVATGGILAALGANALIEQSMVQFF